MSTTADLTNHIAENGDSVNPPAIAILGTLAWCAVVVVPGWLQFLRGDLK